MHIFNLEMSYYENSTPEIKAKVSEAGKEAWDTLFADMIHASGFPTFEKMTAEESAYWRFEGIATAEQAQCLTDYGMKVTLGRVRGMFYDKQPQQLLREANAAKAEVHIHVPGGVALTGVRRVTWLEDACTEELQRHLDEGWRIIAVCPPNDSRRPTYILGRD